MAKITPPGRLHENPEPTRRNIFDGVIKRILDNVNSSMPSGCRRAVHHFGNDRADGRGRGGNGAMRCGGNVEADPKKTSLTFVVGWDAWDAYDQYISDKRVKYSENTEVNRYRASRAAHRPGRMESPNTRWCSASSPPAWTPTCGWGWITRTARTS